MGERTYGVNGCPEDVVCCIEKVYPPGRWMSSKQCSRKRGHGPDGLYCKQHDPKRVADRDETRWKKQAEEEAQRMKQVDRQRAALAAVENIPTKTLEGGVINEMINALQSVIDAPGITWVHLDLKAIRNILAKLEEKEKKK